MRRTSSGVPPRTVGAWFAVVALLGVAGCGGTRQDARESRADYAVEVLDASFPRLQGLGQTAQLRIVVRNAGRSTVPNVGLTLDGLADPEAQPDAMDPSRPIWVVDAGPVGGRTAYVNTWTLGPLAPGARRTFRFIVTSTVVGTHPLHYRVVAGLHGRATAHTPAGGIPQGRLIVHVTRRPRQSAVDPKTGAVVEQGR